MTVDDYNEIADIHHHAVNTSVNTNHLTGNELDSVLPSIMDAATFEIGLHDIDSIISLLVSRYRKILTTDYADTHQHKGADFTPFYDTACLVVTGNPTGLESVLHVIDSSPARFNPHKFCVADISDAWANHYQHAHLLFGRSDQYATLLNVVNTIKQRVYDDDVEPSDVRFTWYAFVPKQSSCNHQGSIARRIVYELNKHFASTDTNSVINAFEQFVLSICTFQGQNMMQHNGELFKAAINNNLSKGQ